MFPLNNILYVESSCCALRPVFLDMVNYHSLIKTSSTQNACDFLAEKEIAVVIHILDSKNKSTGIPFLEKIGRLSANTQTVLITQRACFKKIMNADSSLSNIYYFITDDFDTEHLDYTELGTIIEQAITTYNLKRELEYYKSSSLVNINVDMAQSADIGLDSKSTNEEFSYKKVLNALVDVVLRVTLDGEIEFVNTAVFRLLGYRPEELLGRKALVYCRDIRACLTWVKKIILTGSEEEFKTLLIDKEGMTCGVSCNARLYIGVDHEPRGIECTIRNISNLEAQNNMLKNSNLLMEESHRIVKLGHLEWDLLTDKIIWSEEVYNMYGVEKSAQPTIHNTVGLVHPEDFEYVQESLNLAIQQVRPYNVKHRIIRADNQQVIWVKAQAKLSFDKNGRPLRMLGTVLDITEQMRSERMLEALAEVQRTFISKESVTIAFDKMLNILLDVTESQCGFIGEVLYQKDNTRLKVYSTTSDQYANNQLSEIDADSLNALFDQVMAKRDVIIENNSLQEGCKGEKNAFMGIPFYKENQIIGVVGIASKSHGYNIEAVKILEPFLETVATLMSAYQNELKRQRAEKEVQTLASIVSNSSDAMVSVKEGVITSWNKGAEIMFGYTPEEIVGKPVFKLMSSDRGNEQEKILKKVTEGAVINSLETIRIRKDGQPIFVNISVFPLFNSATGEIDGTSATIRDITKQKEAEQIKESFTRELELQVQERTKALQEIQERLALNLAKEKELGELKSLFVSMTSHQFRTPLTVIKSSLELFKVYISGEGNGIDRRFEKTYQRIERQINKMTNLMNNVLILGKQSSGAIIPTFQAVDLVAVCNGLLLNYNSIQIDDRVLSLKVVGKPYHLSLDLDLLEQALSNLISNAFKYSQGRKSPELLLNYQDNQVVILVKDYGIGIPGRDIKNVFTRFFRASNANNYEGTGLGTSIIKDYIELNKGTITLESVVDKGTSFIVTFQKG